MKFNLAATPLFTNPGGAQRLIALMMCSGQMTYSIENKGFCSIGQLPNSKYVRISTLKLERGEQKDLNFEGMGLSTHVDLCVRALGIHLNIENEGDDSTVEAINGYTGATGIAVVYKLTGSNKGYTHAVIELLHSHPKYSTLIKGKYSKVTEYL